jgi:endonuclease YncB( thermonuclease family)
MKTTQAVFVSLVLGLVGFSSYTLSDISAFVWSFQQPTYLVEKDNTKLASYTCDSEKDTCKVNFDFTSSVPTDEPSTHYSCLIDFWFGVTGEENKCNPNTVEFPMWNWTVHLVVKKIADDSIVTEWSLAIIHPDGSIDPLRVTHTRDWQSPSYLLLKDDISLSEYSCDPEQEECKINLKVTPMLDGVESSLLSCEITSDFDIVPTSDPCNPNTSIVPEGEHTLTIKILDKTKNMTLQTYDIILKNNPPDTTIDPKRVVTDITWQQPTYLLEKEDTSKNEYACDSEKTECKINMLLVPKLDGEESSQLVCHIFTDFGTEENDCNPDTFSVPTWVHAMTLEIKNKATNEIITTRTIQIQGLPVPTGWGGSSASFLDLSSTKIVVQSGLDESSVCRTEMCQVNFLAEVPSLSLCEWDFGGGVFETIDTNKKCNPGYVKFSADATVRLRVIDPYNVSNTIEKTLQLFKTNKKIDVKCTDCEDKKNKIQISAVLANPPRADTVEWIEIENISSETISLDFCKISDESRSYAMSGLLVPHGTIRLRQAITWLTIWNTKDTLTLTCGEHTVDIFSWDFPIPTGYILRRKVLKGIPEQAFIIRTIDGDTIDAVIAWVTTRLRLLGIDTPETVHPRKSVEKFWKEASSFTRTTLEGTTVWLTFDTEPVDHYGRRLAYVWQCRGDFSESNCVLFNAQVVSQGYGRMERRFWFRFYEHFIDLEKQAKESQIWIWSDTEVTKTMNELIRDEKDILTSEQEKEYLELQEELLLECETWDSESCDREKVNWTEITDKLSTISVNQKKSGIVTISGRTWADFPLEIYMYEGENIVEKFTTTSSDKGEYEVSWIPQKIGKFSVRSIFKKEEMELQKEKELIIDHTSPHFDSPLSVQIVLQGQKTENRWREGDVFHCRSRGSCSVNVTAETNREEDVNYFWIFPDGSLSDKQNPAAFNLRYGNSTIILIVFDEITQEIQASTIDIEHIPLPRAAKKTSSAKKYTLDMKEISEDIWWGNIISEKSHLKSLISQLLMLFFIASTIYIFLPPKSH